MKSLDQMTFGQRFLLTLIIVLLLLFALAAIGYFSGRWDEADAEPLPAPSQYDKRIIELEREAIDNGYRRKIEALFTVWLSDPTGQPERAVTGVRRARRAYIGAVTEIDKRAKQ